MCVPKSAKNLHDSVRKDLSTQAEKSPDKLRQFGDKHFEDKCTNVLWSVWTYTTRSSSIKNSASTFWASRASSRETCAADHKVGIGTLHV
jgi:hypothetical protein